jgi:alcohol dehydrogenase
VSVRAALLRAPGEVELRTYDRPRIGSDDGLLRVELAGICGTDVKLLHGTFPGVAYPVVPGHEICGTVEEIGERAARRWGVEVGARVAVDSFLVCGHCEPCLAGDNRWCANLGDYGISIGATDPPHLWGGFAEHVYLARTAQVHPLPDGLTPELGVLVPAVVSNALRWLDDIGGATVGSSVLILGPGPIGLAAVAVARALGAAQVLISGLPGDAHRLEVAQRLGADVVVPAGPDLAAEVRERTGGGADVVLDVSGAPAALVGALGAVRRQGHVVLGGMSGGRTAPMALDPFALDEITLSGVFSHDRAAVRRALDLVARDPAPFTGLVTHTLGLEDVVAAIELVEGAQDGVVKVAIDPWQ